MKKIELTTKEIHETATFSFDHWRQSFLKKVMVWTVLVGFPVALFSSLDILTKGDGLQKILMPSIYFGTWLVLVIAMALHLPSWVKALVFILMIYALAVSSLLETGMRGSAVMFFLTDVILAALLFSPAYGVYCAVAGVLTIMAAAWLLLSNQLSLLSKQVGVGSLNLWVISIISLLLMEAIVIFGLREFLIEFEIVQKQIKHILEKSDQERNLLRTVIDNLPALIYATDKSGKKILSNPTDLAFTKNHSDNDYFDQLDDEILKTGKPLLENEELLLDNKDQKYWFLISRIPLQDENGKTLGLVKIGHEITERKRTADRLGQLSRAIDQSPASIVITDPNGSIEYVNPKFSELTGYTLQEAVGKNPRILKSDMTSDEEYSRLWKTILAGNIWKGEFCNIKKNGEYYWEAASISPIINEKGLITNFVAVKEDITERKSVEAALAESEQRYRSVIEQAYEGIFLINEEGQIITWNHKLERITGNPALDILGKYAWDVPTQAFLLDQDNDGTSEELRTEILDFLKTGQAPWVDRTYERELIHPDNSCTIIEGHNSAIQTNKGYILVGVIQDITESKYSEMSLQRYSDRMEILHKIDESILESHTPEIIAGSALSALQMLIPNTTMEIVQFDLKTSRVISLAHIRNCSENETWETISWDYVNKLRNASPLFEKNYNGLSKTSLFSVPLLVKGELIGALNLYGEAKDIHTLDNIVITREIADQIAIAMRQSLLQLQTSQANRDLLYAYDHTIEGWAKALEMRDMETEGHSQRVVKMTLAFASQMGIHGDELVNIRRGALLHDIGKMGIPDSILRKEGPLDGDEWEIMRQHPLLAYNLLSSIDFLKPSLDIPYCHHEKWDGGGYPRGLRGKEIPPAARIFALVDVWDALTNERIYRPAWTKEKALEYIQDNSGRHFDPEIVKLFIQMMNKDKSLFADVFSDENIHRAVR